MILLEGEAPGGSPFFRPGPLTGAAPAPAPAPAAPSVPVPPNPFAGSIAAAHAQEAALPDFFNSQRQDAANRLTQSLILGGLYETGGSTPVDTGGGNTAYHYYWGEDGRLYRQAYRQVRHGYATRGVYSSSDINDDLAAQKAALDARRALAQQAAEQAQSQTFQTQAGQRLQLAGQVANFTDQGNQSVATQIGNEAPTPPPPSTPAPAAPPAPASWLNYHQFVASHGGVSNPHVAAAFLAGERARGLIP